MSSGGVGRTARSQSAWLWHHRQSRHAVHQLLRHPGGQRDGLQSGSQWRPRPHGAVQRLDLQLGAPIPGNSGTNGIRNEFNPYSIAWYSSRAAAQWRRDDGRSAADQEHLLLRRGLLQQPPRAISQPGQYQPGQHQSALASRCRPGTPIIRPGGAPNNLRVNYRMAIENPSDHQRL